MVNQWILKRLTPEQELLQDSLSTELGVSKIISKLLIDREITTSEEAKTFFEPKLSDLHDPFLIKDMVVAVRRLNKALYNREKILIYGDYDVDGTTAVALVYKYLQQYTSDIDIYIPNRYTEGYGISHAGIDYAKANDFTLIIALDCGIKSIEKVEYAKERSIDFIICDHHTPDDTLPDAVAVLDSKRADDDYPYEHLSGCGVGFKFMQAFAIANGFDTSKLMELLDLVAVSIASDIVPMNGENRILAHYGIKRLNEQPSIGLKAIIDICKLQGKITMNDIVFKIGPRINASGRMKSGKEVVELLISKDINVAKEKSRSIDKHNDKRREADQEITMEAKGMITPEMSQENKSLIVYNPHWKKGVVGIVASRLTEEFYKPTIVLTRANAEEGEEGDEIYEAISKDIISGSARSVQGFDIYAAIDSCRDLLENFGGHLYAAGLSLKESNLEEFTRRFEQYVRENITEEQLQPQIEIDAEINFNEVNKQFTDMLELFQPFGPCNNKPIFATRNIRDCRRLSKRVGKDGDHLKVELVDRIGDKQMSGIAFRMGPCYNMLNSPNCVSVCYTLEENIYNGRTSTQLMVKDFKTE